MPTAAAANTNGFLNAGQPIDLTPLDTQLPATSPAINTDTAIYATRTDGNNGSGNIRFRHMANTQANCLCCDGHVDVYNYNASTQTTDLTRGHVNVNP